MLTDRINTEPAYGSEQRSSNWKHYDETKGLRKSRQLDGWNNSACDTSAGRREIVKALCCDEMRGHDWVWSKSASAWGKTGLVIA